MLVEDVQRVKVAGRFIQNAAAGNSTKEEYSPLSDDMEEAQITSEDEASISPQPKEYSAESCCDVNDQLYVACIEGSVDLVKTLILDGADVNACQISKSGRDGHLSDSGLNEEEWNCPLFQAVWHDHSAIVEVLARNGARYLKSCPVPCHFGHIDSHTVQTDRVAEQQKTNKGSLLQAAAGLCTSAVAFLLDFYHSDVLSEDMLVLLVIALRCRNIEAARAIVDRYPLEHDDENKVTQRLYTLTRHTIRISQPKNETMCLLMLDRFGKLLAEDNSASTAHERMVNLLYIAVVQNLVQTVDKLTQLFVLYVDLAELKKEQCAYDLKSAGDIALSHGNLPILRTLTASGLLDMTKHRNAVFESIGCSRYGANVHETLSWLVSEFHLDIRECNRGGMEAVHFAIKRGDAEAVEALILLGVDANHVHSKDWMTPTHMHFNFCLMQLGRNPSAELLDALIHHGADLSVRNRPGYTALSVLFWLAQIRAGPYHTAALDSRFYLTNVDAMHSFPFDAAFNVIEMDGVSSKNIDSSGSDPEGVSDMGEGSVERSHQVYPDGNDRVGGNSGMTLPVLLQPDRPMRHFIERLANKFGLGLLWMGADTLFGPKHWHVMEKDLESAGISWKHVPSLQTGCWTVIRKCLGGVGFQDLVDRLPVPDKLKRYLMKL